MHVAVTTPSNGSGAPTFGLTLVRMIGFRKMMYDMTMKVVMPAIVSRASVVPCAANWNRRSRIDSRNVAAIVLIEGCLPKVVGEIYRRTNLLSAPDGIR